MKRLKTLMYSAGLLAMISACSNNDVVENRSNSDVLSFSSNIQRASTRVIDNTWEANDAIGVYAFSSTDQALYGGFENVEYTAASAGAEVDFNHASTNTGIVLNGTDAVDIRAYYPYVQNIENFNYPIDVTVASNTNDLLYSSNVKGEVDNAKPNLLFTHALSKFSLELTIDASVQGNLITSLEGLVANEIKGTMTKSSFNLQTGTFGELSNEAAITPMNESSATKVILTAHMIPRQALTNVEVPMTLNGKTFIWKSTINATLAPGKAYLMKAALREVEEGKVVLVNPNASIQDWEVGHEDENPGEIDPEDIDSSLTVSVQSIDFEAIAGDKTVDVVTTGEVDWNVAVSENNPWLTAVKVENGIKVSAEENTTPDSRTATVTLTAATLEPVVITVTQKGKSGEVTGEETTIFEDSFDSVTKNTPVIEYNKQLRDAGMLDSHPNFQYAIEGDGKVDVRSSGNKSVWFPSAGLKTFKLENLNVEGFSNLKLEFSLVGQDANKVSASEMTVKVGDRQLELLPNELLDGGNSGEYRQFNLPIGDVDADEITISFNAGVLVSGIRLDNIVVKGYK